MPYDVKVVERPALLVAGKRALVPVAEIGPTLAGAFGEIYGFLGMRGIAPAGAPFVIYHGVPDPGLPFDLEICAPVSAAPAAPPAGWEVHELPAGSFASLVHVGPYDSIGEAYAWLETWIHHNDLVPAGPPREVYLSEPNTPPAEIRTIVEFPVARVPAVVG